MSATRSTSRSRCCSPRRVTITILVALLVRRLVNALLVGRVAVRRRRVASIALLLVLERRRRAHSRHAEDRRLLPLVHMALARLQVEQRRRTAKVLVLRRRGRGLERLRLDHVTRPRPHEKLSQLLFLVVVLVGQLRKVAAPLATNRADVGRRSGRGPRLRHRNDGGGRDGSGAAGRRSAPRRDLAQALAQTVSCRDGTETARNKTVGRDILQLDRRVGGRGSSMESPCRRGRRPGGHWIATRATKALGKTSCCARARRAGERGTCQNGHRSLHARSNISISNLL